MPVKEYDENGGDVPAPVPAPPSKHPFLQLLVEQDVLDLHLILEGALRDRKVGPTGSAAVGCFETAKPSRAQVCTWSGGEGDAALLFQNRNSKYNGPGHQISC